MTRTPSSVQALLSNTQDVTWQRLIQQSQQTHALDQIVRQCLSDALADHCRTVHFYQGRLSLSVPSSSIATKLRFQIPTLLSQLRKNPVFAGVIGIKIIQHTPKPHLIQRRPARVTPKAPSQQTCEVIKAHAESTTSDALKNRLLQLLKNNSTR